MAFRFKYMLPVGCVAVLLAACAHSITPLSQDEYTQETLSVGFKVSDPPRAYTAAKTLCGHKFEADFVKKVTDFTRFATLYDPSITDEQVSKYIDIVRRTC